MNEPVRREPEDAQSKISGLEAPEQSLLRHSSGGKHDQLIQGIPPEACKSEVIQDQHLKFGEDRIAVMSGMEGDANRGNFVVPQPLLNVRIGSGVTIMDYGTETQLSGRLLGHFCVIEHGQCAPSSFNVDDLVYIEDFFGARHMGHLLGPLWADPAGLAFFDIDGMPREDPGCPYHGHNCIMGQYFSGAYQSR
jgi:hypothetical protein